MSQESKEMFLHAQDAPLPGDDGGGPLPPPTQTCPPCQSIANEIDDLNGELHDLGVKLHSGQGDKGELLKQMKEVERQKAARFRELRQCEEENGCPGPPIPPTRPTVTLAANATLWTSNKLLPGPKVEQISLPTAFTKTPDGWNVEIPYEYLDIDFGNGIRVGPQDTKSATGHYIPASGSMDLDVPLLVTGIPGIDDLEPILTTSGSISTTSGTIPGVPVDANGNVTLVGAVSNIGPLHDTAQLEIQGAFSPWPPK